MSDQSKRPSYLPSAFFNTLMQLSFFGTLGVLFFVLFVRRCSGRSKYDRPLGSSVGPMPMRKHVGAVAGS